MKKEKRALLTDREPLPPLQAAQINPVTLAFVGDAVYSLFVREKLTLEVGGRTADLQRASVKTVSAKGQSAFLDKLLPMLTEEEADIFRRGKNAKKNTKSKNATSLEYNRSTGFEAVIGFLYLTGRRDRMKELFALSTAENFTVDEVAKPFKPVHR